jgi:hypothetical protein
MMKRLLAIVGVVVVGALGLGAADAALAWVPGSMMGPRASATGRKRDDRLRAGRNGGQ